METEKSYLGVMLDCSRNAVWNVSTVKRYMDALKKMGYNMLMLYTEDTYEVDNNPKFGYLRGRYSKDEMKELVSYGDKVGIEMIPCIQTLAHLNQAFRWSEYRSYRDCEDILLIDDERTYTLIENMFRTLRECYHTDKIHIGMDEAHNVGRGKYLDQHGLVNRFELLSRHLNRVAELAEKYGFKPMMWSDMFFRLANNGAYYISDPNIVTDEVKRLVPENVELVYWDYYGTKQEIYDNMIDAHKRFNNPMWFAGGAWMWTGFTPHNNVSMARTELAMKSCREKNVKNIFITCWGDDGGEASAFSVIPALFHAAEVYRGNEDMESIKCKFGELFGISFDDFMKLDLPSVIGEGSENLTENPDKQVVYNDPFLGLFDTRYAEDGREAEKFQSYVPVLSALSDNSEFGYLFKAAAALCDFCAAKAMLGKHTRAAYDSKDKSKLAAVIEEYKTADRKFDAFYYAYRESWMREKKGHGFDVQDIRLGGVKMRLRSCRERLEDYMNGVTDHIDELDEKLIDMGFGYRSCWRDTSANVISFGMNY